ncbi:MAG: VWA domain-containing protein [Candidatus Saccharibacteria bacterium]|nr:VWA domain-containing protein [Candidatus Saccharibacteria bacterium]
MKKNAAILIATLVCMLLGACGSEDVKTSNTSKFDTLSYDDAVHELDALYGDIKPKEISPRLDVDMSTGTVASSLADINTFPIMVTGKGEINIEIAAATELSATAPDDWLNIVAEEFNRSNNTLDGKKVTVSVRKITSGEVVTYMTDGGYRPDCYIPSNSAWGEMLDSKSIKTIKITDRVAGNTAGILMKKTVYEQFIADYKEVTVANVLKAANNGDIVFAYTNPYTSSTGLNILSAMLYAFDNQNSLSDEAVNQLIEYQRNAPTAAYTTAVLKNSAAKGIIDVMVMEEQAYINTPELSDYVFTPAGIRHDHPVYTFDYVSAEKQQAVKMFTEYCLTDEMQKLATQKGFNRHDDYKSQENGMDGNGYFAAQRVWKQNKNGGRPTVAVFVSDISGSMKSSGRLTSLKESLLNTMQYIDSNCYVGLVSFDDRVFINLPIGQFDNQQRAYFSGAVKDLSTGGETATYDATVGGMKMLLEAQKEISDAKLLLFVLSDGDQNTGYRLSRVAPIVDGLNIPVYTIGYEMAGSGREELKQLSSVNEAAIIDADVEGIVNELRNLFNVNM